VITSIIIIITTIIMSATRLLAARRGRAPATCSGGRHQCPRAHASAALTAARPNPNPDPSGGATASSFPLLRAVLLFRGRQRGIRALAAAAAASSSSSSSSSSGDALPSSPLSSPISSSSLEAVRLAASLGLRRGLRTAAAAAGAKDAASLEGRLLPSYLVAAAASSSSPSPPFLLRLMEQRFALGGGGSSSGSGGATSAPQHAVITVVTPHDVDAIFDALQARGAEDGDPYWARVWPSAVALAECLLARPELVRGLRVADVGAGLGVAGLAAALAGARDVALLDREPLALECARLSAEATALTAGPAAAAFGVARPSGGDAPAVPVVDASGQRLLQSVREVLGREEENGANGSPSYPATVVRAEPFDWHARPLPASLRGAFDVVLACDVLYEQDAVAPLAGVLPLLLAPSNSNSRGGRVLLADPPARTAENRERFLELMAKGGGKGGKGAAALGQQQTRRFAVDEASLAHASPVQLDRELLGGQGDRPVPVQLMHLRAVDGNDTVGLKL
jgi:ETFB lysine methyltransferase